jgi:hypothetical protein
MPLATVAAEEDEFGGGAMTVTQHNPALLAWTGGGQKADIATGNCEVS